MRTTFAHHAVLLPDPGFDRRAPGAAVTVALCGSWQHDGPCPLAAHHTATRPDGARWSVRVLFATGPGDEATARARIVAALEAGRMTGPQGAPSAWRLVEHEPSDVLPGEQEHAARLARSL